MEISTGGPVLPRQPIVHAAPLVSVLFVATAAPVPGAERLPPDVGGSGLIVAGAVVLSLLAGIVAGLLFSYARCRRTKGQLSGTVAEPRSAGAVASGTLRELEGIMAAIPDILFTIDPAGNMVRWNKAAETATGLPPEKISGRPVLSFIVEEDRPAVANAMREVLEKGETETEARLLGARGDAVPFHWKGVLLRDERGKVLGITGVGRDVSERRRAEEEQQKLAAIIENSSDMIGIASLDGKILYINPAGQKLVGLDGIEEVRKTTLDQYVMPQHRDLLRDLTRALVSRGSWRGEARVRNFKTGKSIPIELNGFIINDPATGRPLFMGNVSRDITDRKRMEEELLKAQKLESVGILAGGIAHDFNNLLTAILGNITLAKTYAGSASRSYGRLEEAEKASLRARDLTQQLLTFSRGGMPVKRTASIENLVRESAGFALSGARSRCEFSFPGDLPPVFVDPGQIGQVVHNLVVNADQAMADGGTVRVSGETVLLAAGEVPPLKPGQYVRICVADRGVGIPGENLSKIFDPYFTTKRKGNGLGLATAYAIVRKHDGHISVESRVGAGATFHLYLPAAAGTVPEPAREPERPPAGKGKVLVMDDEEMVRGVAADMLAALGYEAAVAEDGAAAVALYREARESGASFDAVIMDLTVPGGMGGKEAIRILREIDPDVRAVVSSGYSNDPVMSEYERYGFLSIVIKPYTAAQLGEALRKVIPPK